MSEPLVILAARRTPIGAFQGVLASVSATQLGAVAARAALADAGLAPDAIDEVIFGCVLPAGLGQAPARQAAVGAGIALGVPATTVNKMCGSGMKAVMMAADQIRAGSTRIMLAGGLESMTNAPYLLTKARGGFRMGHGEIYDHMFYDGLQSPWDGKAMGCFADATAAKYGFTRDDQDAFAAESVRRAQRAVKDGDFAAEIAPVTVKTRKGEQLVDQDETPFTVDIAKIPNAEACLQQGRHRHGRLVVLDLRRRRRHRARERVRGARRPAAKPIARLVSYASHAQAPEWFTTAPAPSIQKALDRAGWKTTDVDLYEINEAFACVDDGRDEGPRACRTTRVNVNGGACAMGHPIGATGARLITTLIHALRKRGLRRGVASQCIGGGEACAVAIELV